MRTIAWLFAAALLAGADDAAAVRRDVAKARVALALQCEKDGLREEAVREWQEAKRDDPSTAGAAEALARLGAPSVPDWDDALQEKFAAYSRNRARLHDETARRWLALGDAKSALALVPDFTEAREKQGEILAGGAWVPKESADKLLNDLLFIDGKWLPAEEVKKRRSVWAEAWEIRGAHFVVRSNRSEAAARAVLALAESVYAAVHRELAGEVDPPPLKKLLSVFDFATRADYLAHLDAAHDGGGDHRQTAGFFSSLDGASHFAPAGEGFGLGDEDVERHEITHQVCDALWPPQGMLAEHPHFWVWEGVAAFFESMTVRDGKILVGDRRHPRFDMARRALEDRRTLPLDEYVQLEGDGVKGRYNQAASLVGFFLQADHGKHREPFLKYLRIVASGKAEAGSFEKSFGRKPAEFEAAWESWLSGAK